MHKNMIKKSDIMHIVMPNGEYILSNCKKRVTSYLEWEK